MLIRDIGEFGLIEYIKKKVKLDHTVIKGIGDDCAVLKFKKTKYLLFSSDMLVANVDFTCNTPPYFIGRKSLGVVLSDIASCAGIPHYALLSLGLPPKTKLDFVDKFFDGFLRLAKEFKVNLVGGDISKADNFVIDVSVIGEVEKKFLTLREGACVKDIIFVSGSLGGSIKSKHINFTPRIREARFLVKNFKINAMIDISDGLVADLHHILKQSNLGAVLYEKLIPLSKDASDLEDALYNGEDFELLFTLSYKEARRLSRSKIFKPIGEIIESKDNRISIIKKDGKEDILKIKGYRHF